MIQVIILILFIYVSAKYDSILINGGHYIDDHTSRFIFRGVVILIVSWFNLFTFLGLGLVFASLFDPLLNYYRKLGFWYLGSIAKWDIFWKKHLVIYKILRFWALVLGLYLIFS